MKSFLLLIGLIFVWQAHAANVETVVLASLDLEKATSLGLRVTKRTDMPDFTITSFFGAKSTDVISVYEGGHPSTFSSRGKRLGEIKADVAEQRIVWVCWSEEQNGKRVFGAEFLMPSKRVIIGTNQFVDELFHVFAIRDDLQSLAEARILAASLIKKESNQSLVPTAPSGRGSP
jgi:hypothetical protein